jgi:VWFA-related protein
VHHRKKPESGASLHNQGAVVFRRGFFSVIFFCLSSVITLSAQEIPLPTQLTAQQPNQATAVRVTTHLVQVNVVVNDKHGNPIIGLLQDDFSIFDNGKRQPIRIFSAETNLPSAASPTLIPPEIYTNRPEERSKIPASVTVILLDALNTEVADQTLARKQVLQVLRKIQPHEYVALYWLGNGLRILHDFTADASVLQQVLAGFESKSSRQLENSALADPSLTKPNPSAPSGAAYERQAFRLAFDQRVANQSARERVRATAAAMSAIAGHLATRKGRKNLVWVSASFPITLGYDKFDLNWANDTGENFSDDVRKAARALAAADIAVYPVDARGLLGSAIGAISDDLDAHIGDPTDTDAHLPTRGAPEALDTMKLLAERTGGKAFYGSNDIAGAIRRAMDDSRVTYTIGFYAEAVKWDGSFHELKVRVAVPGAEVHSRSGYFALLDPPVNPAQNDQALIAQLAPNGIPATGIGLHVRIRNSSDAHVAVELHLDLRELQMLRSDDHWTGKVRSAFLQMDSAGHILQVDDRTFNPELDNAAYEKGLQLGITDTRELRLVPSATQLCIVVRDLTNSKMGSIYVPVPVK